MAHGRNKPGDETALTVALTGNEGILNHQDVADLAKFFDEGFQSERTFWIGNPDDKKIPLYLGELLGPGGTVQVTPPGDEKIDPETGVVETNDIPVWLFHPIDLKTLRAIPQAIHSVLSSHAVNTICQRYYTLAEAKSAQTKRPHRAQILFRWEGIIKTRKARQLNDIRSEHRIVDIGTVDVETSEPSAKKE